MLVGQVGGFLLPVLCGAVVGATAGGAAALFGVLAVVHFAILAVVRGFRETGRAARAEDSPAGTAAAAEA